MSVKNLLPWFIRPAEPPEPNETTSNYLAAARLLNLSHIDESYPAFRGISEILLELAKRATKRA